MAHLEDPLDAPFVVTEPPGHEIPVLVEIPHAGIALDPATLCNLVAPARSVARDADLYVDRLYADAPLEGATVLRARMSRYVLDLNRGEGDIDSDSVEGAPTTSRASRGLVWRLTSDGGPVLVRPLTRAELVERTDAIYRPYHRALREILDRKLARFGHVVLLAAHSMPSVGRSAHGDLHATRADVVPGTRGRTSAGVSLIDAVDAHGRAQGWSVVHDEPYRGGFTTMHYGRPSSGVHAIQVELARRLYMDEATLRPREPGFGIARAWCRALVAKLGQTAVR